MCLLMFVVVSQLIKPSLFTSLWGGSVQVDFIFKIMLGSKENIHHFLSNIRITLILTFRIIQSANLQNCTTHPSQPDAKFWWKRVSNLIKESEKHIYYRKVTFVSMYCLLNVSSIFYVKRQSFKTLSTLKNIQCCEKIREGQFRGQKHSEILRCYTLCLRFRTSTSSFLPDSCLWQDRWYTSMCIV